MPVPQHAIRAARPEDIEQLLRLWASLFDETPLALGPWADNARAWFVLAAHDDQAACFPVIEANGTIVACAVGTLELGVPNPHSPRGRLVRLANVITDQEHRNQGCGSALVESVIAWARRIDADRVDLSATPDGQRIYERAGFVITQAPRMKLPL